MNKIFYRYESERYSTTIDAERELYGVSSAMLECSEYKMVSETPKGYWLTYGFGRKDKWVSKTSRKRFAHPSEEEALEAYRYRKEAFVRHSHATLARAVEDLALVQTASASARDKVI